MDLKVMQWNILADGYAFFSEARGDLNYHDYTEDYSKWDNRKSQILNIIRKHDPDIICLQENDHHEELLNKLENYEGLFSARRDSTCFLYNGRSDGVSIYWKNKLEKEKVLCGNFEVDKDGDCRDGKESYLAIKFNYGDEQFVIATAHLQSMKSNGGENTRVKQITQLKKDLFETFAKDVPIILTLDLNSAPTSHQEKYCFPLRAYDHIRNFKFQLQSAYENYFGKEPTFTCAKKRLNQKRKATCIDFVFYTPDDFVVGKCEQMPLLKNCGKNYLPNEGFPSDHVELVVSFKFNKKQ